MGIGQLLCRVARCGALGALRFYRPLFPVFSIYVDRPRGALTRYGFLYAAVSVDQNAPPPAVSPSVVTSHQADVLRGETTISPCGEVDALMSGASELRNDSSLL